MHACTHASDRPTVDCSFSSDSEEISEIHWICDEDIPNPEVQSIMPGKYVIHVLSHLAGTPPSGVAPKARLACGVVDVDESSDSRSHGNSIRSCD